MNAPRRSRIDIVGGGYDYLAALSRSGARCLSDARLILHYKPLSATSLRMMNREARLESWRDPDHLVDVLESLPPDADRVAVLLGDGIACPRLLGEMNVLASRGVILGYHPTISLRESALVKAGFQNGDLAELHAIPSASLAKGETQGLPRLESEREAIMVAFDGRVLWPPRRLASGSLLEAISCLPPTVMIYVVVPSRGATPDLPLGLAGRGVVVTRAAEQADDLALPLLARGATPFLFPAITFVDPPKGEALDRALERLQDFDGIIFTSSNTVERFLNRLFGTGRDARALAGIELFAVGEKTAATLLERSLRPDAVPASYRAEGLIQILQKRGAYGRNFLLPRAEEAREILPERIRQLGGEVEILPLYRTVTAETDTGELWSLHLAGLLDAITFTSGSTIRHFVQLLGKDRAGEILRRATIACIGPVAADDLRQAGFEAAVVPAKATVEDLVTALDNHFTAMRR